MGEAEEAGETGRRAGGATCGRDVEKKRRAACVGPYVSGSERGATPQMVGEKWAAAAVRALIPLAASAKLRRQAEALDERRARPDTTIKNGC